MATRLYLRGTQNNISGYVFTKKSTALPVGTLNDVGQPSLDLSTTKGAAQAQNSTIASLAQTAQQSGYGGKLISDVISSGNVTAQSWTIALATSESSTNANSFTAASIYILTSGDTVRGYIYDAATQLGSEYAATETGQVLTVTGSAVSGVVGTDRIAFEWWIVATQAMATSYSNALFTDGTTDVTAAATSDAASYIETPQALTFGGGAGPTVTPTVNRMPKIAVQRASYY